MEPTHASELRWIDDGLERDKVAALHKLVAAELPGWPDEYAEELHHDIHVCRFLRGHQNQTEKAAEKLIAAVKYRSELSAQPHVKAMREKMGEATAIDLSALPHAEEVLRCLPFRTVMAGAAANGLPLAIMPVRLVDPKVFAEVADQIDTFLRCMLEARAIVLHHLSVKQKRMAKFVELRDFNNVYIREMLLHGRPFIARVKSLMVSVQDHYPELIHQAIVAHAPTTFSNAFSLVSSVLNERMRAKICVVGASESFARYAELLDAHALNSWGSMLESSVDWSRDVSVSACACEFAARWLRPGDTLNWCVAAVSGDGVRLTVHWVPAADGASGAVPLQDTTLAAAEACTGTYAAPADGAGGVVWVCADNSASWYYARVVRATLDVVAAPSPAPVASPEPVAELTAAAAAVELN